MNGKELKVVENEFKFGAKTRIVNVFGVFKYKPNGGLYVIYVDVDTKNSYVCYGSAHVKNGSILCMHSNKQEDTEAVKEYIFKVINEEKLDDFEIISLNDVNEIEIIGSKNFEIKNDVLEKLIEKTIPQKEKTLEQKEETKKKSSPISTILFILILALIGGGVYYYYDDIISASKVSKVIYCTKQYPHEEVTSATVEETKRFKFGNDDRLTNLEETTKFVFSTEDAYLDFINKSLYLKYMPDESEDTKSKFNQDNDKRTVTFEANTIVDESYIDPVEYEEVLSNNTTENYTCEEKIEK